MRPFFGSWMIVASFVLTAVMAQAAPLTYTYTYDDLNRLTQVSYGNAMIKYTYDQEGNRLTLASGTDTDADGLYDHTEISIGTNPSNPDSDGDGMPDGWEYAYGLNPLFNDASGDADGDGLANVDEYTNGTEPDNADSDFDHMTDGWEVLNGLDPLTGDADGDLDGDGFSNLREYLKGSNPNDSGSVPMIRSLPGLNLLFENSAQDSLTGGSSQQSDQVIIEDPASEDLEEVPEDPEL